MQVSKRLLAGLTVCALLLGQGLTGFAKVKIQFMGWEASPYETQSVLKGLDLFMKRNPDIEVEYIAGRWDDHHAKLLTMMAGGAAPDVFFLGAEPFYRDFQKRGVLLDLTDFFNKELSLEDFIPLDREKMLINGRIYGISSCIVAPVLYYNKDLFDRAGVPYPPADPRQAWKWEEFVAAARKLTITQGKRTVQYGVYGLETYWWPFVWSNGGRLFNEDYTRFVLHEDEPGQEALTRILELRTRYNVAPSALYLTDIGMNPNQMLQTGRVAMLVDGSWALQELSQLGFRVGVAPLPVFKYPVTSGTAHLHAAWIGTKHPEEAWRLIRFLSSEEYQLDLVRSGLWMPNRTALYTAEGMRKWLNPSVHPDGFDRLASYFVDYARLHPGIMIPAEAWNILTEEMDYYWRDNQPLSQVLNRAAARINPLLGQYR